MGSEEDERHEGDEEDYYLGVWETLEKTKIILCLYKIISAYKKRFKGLDLERFNDKAIRAINNENLAGNAWRCVRL